MAKAGVVSLIFIAVFGFHVAHGMDCSLGTSDNVIDKFISSCPRPLIDSSDESYCCWQASKIGDKYDVHCCNFVDFSINTISLALPLIIICLVVSFIVSCVCCLCCPCCCFYKRRSGGRVLRPGPMVVTVGPYAMPPQAPYQPLYNSGVLRPGPMVVTVGPYAMPPQAPYQPLYNSGVLRPGPMVVTIGPYAMPPQAPYQPLYNSDGRGFTA